ncbi:MAG TPA: ABC transporter permease, partial [Acidimicrobiales bacterium]|nr:ABC transporter permease [Acidimicrobiales bacterium]
VQGMPGWLQVFARNQPVTQTIEAVRALTLGEGPTARPALQAVLWAVGIIAVCAPLAARGYRRAA